MTGSILTGSNIVLIACRMLFNINESILRHNEHTAYLALSLMKNQKLNPKCSERNLVLMSLFHTLGFFSSYVNHQNQFDSEQDYFSSNKATESKYVFTCHYLENMTPLKKDAHCLATFTEDYAPLERQVLYHTEYKSIIYLCARISDYLHKNKFNDLPEDLNELAPGKLDPEYVRLFKVKNQGDALIRRIQNGTYLEKLTDYINQMTFTPEEETQLLKLLVYILDFKSTQTLVHSINTGSYALSMGKLLNLSQDEQKTLFISAILHDIGKTRTPKYVLEARARLSVEQKKLIQGHVSHSRNILRGLVPDEIVEIVYSHHELCNGQGYPNHLTDEQIPKLAKILTVADVASSLMDMRSYKQSYDKDRTLQIMQMETVEQRFNFEYAGTFLNYYDQIKDELPEVQTLFTVNFADIMDKYNNYIFNEAQFSTESKISEELEELEPAED